MSISTVATASRPYVSASSRRDIKQRGNFTDMSGFFGDSFHARDIHKRCGDVGVFHDLLGMSAAALGVPRRGPRGPTTTW